MAHSTKAVGNRKPYKDFPLTPRADGRWCKKARGKVHIFSGTAEEALAEWLRVKDELLAGRKPRPQVGEYLSVADLCNKFLTWKQQLLDSGELAQRTFDQYYEVCALICESFGKTRAADDVRPDDFQSLRATMAKKWGAVRLGNQIGFARSVFKFAAEEQLLAHPVSFGKTFKKPSAKTIRRLHAEAGPKMFTPEQVHGLLDKATTNMRCMILLAINAGMGNSDVALLPLEPIDLNNPWLNYPRRKTWIARMIPLWPETVEALQSVIEQRRPPLNEADADLLFIGPRGESYTGNLKGYRVTQEFDRVALRASVSGRTFYDFRRTFQTIGEGANDLAAVRSIMGHAPPTNDMSSVYRQQISDDRLKAVVNHVRFWLWQEIKPKRPIESQGERLHPSIASSRNWPVCTGQS